MSFSLGPRPSWKVETESLAFWVAHLGTPCHTLNRTLRSGQTVSCKHVPLLSFCLVLLSKHFSLWYQLCSHSSFLHISSGPVTVRKQGSTTLKAMFMHVYFHQTLLQCERLVLRLQSVHLGSKCFEVVPYNVFYLRVEGAYVLSEEMAIVLCFLLTSCLWPTGGSGSSIEGA